MIRDRHGRRPLSRRRFLRNSLVGAASASIATPYLISCSGNQQDMPDASTMTPPDGAARRTFNQPSRGGYVIEGGGQWVGPTQTAVLALAQELDIAHFPAHVDGDMVYHFEGFRFTGPDSGEPDDPAAAAEYRAVRGELERMMRQVPLEAPWDAPEATSWDAQTIGAWLGERLQTYEARELMELEIDTALGDPAQISLLWYLFYLHAAGGTEALATGAQSSRLVGGAQALSLRMAAELGERVHLSAPVITIDYDTAGGDRGSLARIVTTRGTIEAPYVVMALMPKDLTRIDFRPSLPELRGQLNQRWAGSTGIKVHLVYERPFWRDAGLSGVAVTDFSGVGITFDNSPPDASSGVLLAFVDSRGLSLDRDARQREITDQIGKLFGSQAAEPLEYHEMDWSGEEWTAGCTSPLPPGLLTSAGMVIRQPHACIHWAGTETATVWNGYMDGAVRSGHRAAQEILARLL